MPGEDQAIGAITQGIGGVLNFGVGVAQRAQGNKLLKKLGTAPKENIPNAILQNQQMATNAANVGLPQEQYNNAMKNIQRQQMMALRSAGDRHGVLGSLAGITQAGMDATGNLDARDAAARANNQKALYGINNLVGNWQDKIWQNNVNNPYMRQYQYAQSLLGTGNQNAVTGLDQIGATGALYASGSRNSTSGGGGGSTNYGLTGYRNQYTPATPISNRGG